MRGDALSRRPDVDFHYVEPKHYLVHDALVNWARWNGRSPRANVSPMFVGVKVTDVWESSHASIPVNEIEAVAMEKAVYHLPADHRTAVRWSYVYRTAPHAMARKLGCTLEMLARLVRDGRQMLVNRTT